MYNYRGPRPGRALAHAGVNVRLSRRSQRSAFTNAGCCALVRFKKRVCPRGGLCTGRLVGIYYVVVCHRWPSIVCEPPGRCVWLVNRKEMKGKEDCKGLGCVWYGRTAVGPHGCSALHAAERPFSRMAERRSSYNPFKGRVWGALPPSHNRKKSIMF